MWYQVASPKNLEMVCLHMTSSTELLTHHHGTMSFQARGLKASRDEIQELHEAGHRLWLGSLDDFFVWFEGKVYMLGFGCSHCFVERDVEKANRCLMIVYKRLKDTQSTFYWGIANMGSHTWGSRPMKSCTVSIARPDQLFFLAFFDFNFLGMKDEETDKLSQMTWIPSLQGFRWFLVSHLFPRNVLDSFYFS